MRHIVVGSLSLSIFALVFTGCCSPNQNCHDSIGPSTGEVVGIAIGAVAAVGVGTAVIVHTEHSHHNVKGCVFNGPDNLEIEDTGNHKRFVLTGATSDLKEGMLVSVHGSRAKMQKGSKTDQAFVVESLKKNYGACTVTPPSPAKAGS